MREYWAERLLVRVMKWSAERIAEERSRIQAMAEYKYDEYQQFAPGMHFVESLALWLEQFETTEERESAYQFVTDRLIFLSTRETQHLVSISYPDVIRPTLIRMIAEETKMNPYHVGRIVVHPVFKQRIRQCLFAGLSDGAHIGTFRRFNRNQLTNEQIVQSHEITKNRAESLCKDLRRDLIKYGMEDSEAQDAKFRTIVFLDDFSGSGMTCVRVENSIWKGKIPAFFSETINSNEDEGNPLASLLDIDSLRVFVVLYTASEQAISYLREQLATYWRSLSLPVAPEVYAVYQIPHTVSVRRENSTDPMAAVQSKYFDADIITDAHIEKSKTDGRFGFADAGLPLVLSHNSPNNSISLLWAYEHCQKQRGLFPRVSRHLDL